MQEIFNKITTQIKKRKNESIIIAISLIILNLWTYSHIFKIESEKDLLQIYFLDVGQGDAILIKTPGGATILTDGGPPNKRLLHELDKALSPFDRSIDVIINTHAQSDHFGGLTEAIQRYRVTAFASNGMGRDIPSYHTLENTVAERKVEKITLAAGDKIRHGKSTLHILWPTPTALTEEDDLNDSSIVSLLESANTTLLLTADIGKNIEQEIAKTPNTSNINILKVAHHGSKNSSDETFIQKANPRIAVIQVGKNSYGHPTQETLTVLENVSATIYRNDTDGTIKITSDGEHLRVFKL
jgi:competence protein ComEC